jgi:hypothetical protein
MECGAASGEDGRAGSHNPHLAPHPPSRLRALAGEDILEDQNNGVIFVVLPVRIELTTSPLPRLLANSRIYFTALSFWPGSDSLGADLVLHATSPASIDGASCETLTWA